MSRGRKAKSNTIALNSKQLFERNIGNYFQKIIIELGKLPSQQSKDTLTLLEQITFERGIFNRQNKIKTIHLPSIEATEIPFKVPQHWEWCRLGQICNYGSSPKAEPRDLKDDTWVLDLEDIEKESSRLLKKIRLSQRSSLSTKNVFRKGDVLYSKLRPYLDKVIVADEDGVCTTEILPLKLFGDLDPFFIMYSLKSRDFLLYVNSVTRGMKMPRLGTKEGRMAMIPLAPVNEQRAIVKFLHDLKNEITGNNIYFNSKIEKTIISLHKSQLSSSELDTELTHQLSLVEQLRHAFVRDGTQGKLVPQDPNDEPAKELLKKIKAEKEQLIKEKKIKKEKDLPPIKPEEIPFEIPKSWVWCRLQEVCLQIVDCPHSTPKYLETDTGYYSIDTTCIEDSGEISRLRFLSKDGYYARVKRLVPTGKDLVYSREGSIGLAAFIPSSKKICLGQRVMLLRSSQSFLPELLRFVVTDSNYIKRLLEKHRGIGAKHVNVKDITMSLVPLPPLSEQSRIVAKLEQLMKYCDELKESVTQSQTQNEQLLQQVLREALQPKEKHLTKKELAMAAEL